MFDIWDIILFGTPYWNFDPSVDLVPVCMRISLLSPSLDRKQNMTHVESKKPVDITFWSKSPTEDQRYLSNFTVLPDPLGVTAALCKSYGLPFQFEGSFQTIEAAYQAAKWHATTATLEVKEAMLHFMIDATDGLQAKRAGSKKAMKQKHCRLDPKIWTNTIQERVMQMVIHQRAKVDAKYDAALDMACRFNFVWKHIETRKAVTALYWGGCHNKKGEWVGLNRLGHLMYRVASDRRDGFLE